MTETDYDMAVVFERELIQDAYEMGYERAAPDDFPDGADPHEAVSHFKESATWANNTGPRLRAMAGYADRGHGTYTEPRTVVLVPPETEDDTPAGARSFGAATVHSWAVEAHDRGMVDGLEGEPFDVPAASVDRL